MFLLFFVETGAHAVPQASLKLMAFTLSVSQVPGLQALATISCLGTNILKQSEAWNKSVLSNMAANMKFKLSELKISDR